MEPRPIDVEAARLVIAHRWAGLATTGPDGPLASMVAYAPETDLSGILMFLSGLSDHTGHLLESRRASLVISEIDTGAGDPQTLARVTLTGSIEPIHRETDGFGSAWGEYVARFPDAEPRLALADFILFRLRPERVRYVGGFAMAFTIGPDRLAAAATALGPA